MRNDHKKYVQKVAGEIAKDPLASQRDVAKKAGVGLGTVNRAKNELEQNGTIEKSDDVIRIAEQDLVDLEKIQLLEGEHIDEYASKANKGEYLKPTDLDAVSRIGERRQKRRSMLLGENTGKDGEEKEIKTASNEELRKLAGLSD